MELLGFEVRRKAPEVNRDLDAITPPNNDDGSLIVAEGGSYGTVVDLEGAAKNEAELVTKYREMAMHAEVEQAIDDIVNDAIVKTDDEDAVRINLDGITNINDTIKKAIAVEFSNVLTLLDFTHQGYDIFKRWYIDGRLYYQTVIDKNNPRDGIQEFRYIDPRKIKKIKETKRKKLDGNTGATVTQINAEYYIYNDKGFSVKPTSGPSTGTTTGLKIAKDSILYCTSGLLDKTNSLVISCLHKAIKPLNQLRALEDATIIYRISRAPERRIFYIDVGNLPKMKAEQYLRDMMQRHKNKVVYDAGSGEIRDDRKFMTMLEDFWLPRREGGRGTEITTLPGGQNLGEMTDVEYFQKVLFKSLNVPVTRLQAENAFTMGRATEVSRDEVKFAKFIDRLRSRFNHLFLKALEKQLVLKGVITQQDWNEYKNHIKFNYATDSYFAELKELEVLKDKINAYEGMAAAGIVGKYYSNQWVRKNLFRQDDQFIARMDKEIQEEQSDSQYNPTTPEDPNAQQNANNGQPII